MQRFLGGMMETLRNISELCEKHLTQGEIDRLIQHLRTLRARKAAATQV